MAKSKTRRASIRRGDGARPAPSPAQLAAAKTDVLAKLAVKDYAGALAVCRDLIARGARGPHVYHDAAYASLHLGNWQDAVGYARHAAALAPHEFGHFDVLSHAAGGMRDWKLVREAGHRALRLRAQSVAQVLPVDLPLAPRGPFDGAADGLDIIAFSLFGGNSKYCETAILNCQDQPSIYPGWRCRFYIDDTVPAQIVQRIIAAGGEVERISAQMQAWPGPMWRFAALDDPRARRVIFRDADSVISQREAGAVAEWIASNKAFHAMRDSGSHTELMLAGLWGAQRGALPAMADMITLFLQKPLTSAHFADQLFLRDYVWPFARGNILQHDSLFGFDGGRAFPDGPHRDDFHVGYAEGSPFVTITTRQAEGSTVNWCLVDKRGGQEQLICRYSAVVANGQIIAHLPARYARMLGTGEMTAFVEISGPS